MAVDVRLLEDDGYVWSLARYRAVDSLGIKKRFQRGIVRGLPLIGTYTSLTEQGTVQKRYEVFGRDFEAIWSKWKGSLTLAVKC